MHRGEPRDKALRRKLREECGLAADSVTEVGTYDVILPVPGEEGQKHGITTLYRVRVHRHGRMLLDHQSAAAEWRPSREWRKEALRPFVRKNLPQPGKP